MSHAQNHQPLVSLVVPIYNVADYLEQCLASIQSQSYTNLEITINLSKPEKDPREIAAAKTAQNTSGEKYPACQLCLDNEGLTAQGRVVMNLNGGKKGVHIHMDDDGHQSAGSSSTA